MKALGTSEVIELLETYLDLARKQRWGSVAVVLTGHPGVAAGDFAGDITLEESTHEALDWLQKRVENSIAGWRRPPRDEKLDASYVCYNVANGPLGFDYLIWLIDAEMTRVRERAPAPLKVGFWLGRDPEARMHSDRRGMWLENVFRPCLEFIGAVEDPAAVHGRCKEVFVPRDIVAACRAGEVVPQLRTKQVWGGPPNPVTITLREADHYSSRNSNNPAWIRFARWLQETQGETVIVVRDTAKATHKIDGVRTSPIASCNLAVRLALYNAAKCNLFVSNGPLGLAIFGSRPWLAFHAANADADEICNTPEFWEKNQGIKLSEQYPWSRPDQRLIWQADTYENLVAIWTEMAGKMV